MPLLGAFAPNESSGSSTGTYLIKRGNKDVHVGKGSIDRMHFSMSKHLGISCVYYPAASEELAFANETYFMYHYGAEQSMGGR